MTDETRPPKTARLPHLGDQMFVTDGGLETDLIFNRHVELPHFASFPLMADEVGRQVLRDYYDGYATVARHAGVGLLLETPTWRANPDWGSLLGYSRDELRDVNVAAARFLSDLRNEYADEIDDIVISGVLGPRGDGYVSAGEVDADEAASYHADQIAALAAGGVDIITALTLNEPGEAIGIVRAARAAGLPVAIAFVVETNGRLAAGLPLADAIALVEAAAPPDYYLINCAHPTHIEQGLTAGAWLDRIVGVRANASTKSHAELDESTELDDGDIDELVEAHRPLRALLPNLRILGGCCGTDARHVAALWDVDWPPAPRD